MSQSQGLHEQPLYAFPYGDGDANAEGEPGGLPSQRPQGAPAFAAPYEPLPYDPAPYDPVAYASLPYGADTYAPGYEYAAHSPHTPYAPDAPESAPDSPYGYGPVSPYGYGADSPYAEEPGPHAEEPGAQAPPEAAVAAPSAGPGGRAAARKAERQRRSAARPESGKGLVPQALVVACLAGGTSAFVAHDKQIELNVDGHTRTVHTYADNVGELLDNEALRAGHHDAVDPSPGHRLANGEEIALRYGRPLTLTLDGQRRRVWTTARTVDEALRQLGVRAEGAHLSAPRSAEIGRQGRELEVRTERSVTFVADGREHTVRTNAATVAEAVEQAGIELRGYDTTSVPPESFPRDGQTINVMRITGSQKVQEEPVRFDTVRREDPDLAKGTEVVVHEGKQGVKRVTYQLRTVNGVKRKPRKIGQELVSKPQTRVVKVGTKELPDSVQGADGLNWDGLADCESGGDPGKTDPSGTYGGLYQFDTQTWHALGGSGSAQEAPAEEQTFRAKKLYVDRGSSPWPVCGRKLSQ